MNESASSFRDSSPYATATAAALSAGAVVDIAFLILLFMRKGDAAAVSGGLGQFHLLVRFVGACAFLTWFDCAYANLQSTKYPRWWAVLGFFVPPFALFRPCEIAAEIYRDTSRRNDQPVVVYVWWASLLTALFFFALGNLSIYYVTSIASAAATIVMVRTLTGQEETMHRAAALEQRGVEAPPPATAPQRAPQHAPLTLSEPIPPLPAQAMPSPLRARTAATPRIQTRRAADTNWIWVRALSILLGLSGFVMLTMAAEIGFHEDRASRVLAAIYATSGFLIMFLSWLFARNLAMNRTRSNWSAVAIAGGFVAVANIIVIAGMVV